MTLGPGKYDDIATRVREETQATGVIVIVLGGNQGNGFSGQFVVDSDDPRKLVALQVGLLRATADEIEKDVLGLAN